MRSAFRQVDVFAGAAFAGNPLAVVHDGAALSGEAMQRIARWTNLSETTFLLPPTTPEADYRVRIFTPARELPFAGHPTLGSAHAWLEAGGAPAVAGVVVQECDAGLVPLRRKAGRLAFRAPPLLRSGPVEEAHVAALATILGLSRSAIVEAQWVDNGPGWVAVMLEDAAAVLAVEADAGRWTGPLPLDVGLVGRCPQGSPCAFEVRALFTDADGSLREDPATGSLNASLAQWLLGSGHATAPYVASQGTRLGRTARIHITRDGEGAVWVGGDTVTRMEGAIDLAGD